MPWNVDVGPFQEQALSMLRRSDTFRRQCERIAATRVLRVRFELTPFRSQIDRASTVVRRYEAGGIRADVTIRFAGNYVELIAHELEHVLEQVEGVDLWTERSAGRAQLIDTGAFETRRATAAGLQVWTEFEMHPKIGRPLPAGRSASTAAAGLSVQRGRVLQLPEPIR
jgi:hypothetical protein